MPRNVWNDTELSNRTIQQLYQVSTPRVRKLVFLWSVSKLTRSITKWTKVCDKRLSRLISYIHHTCEYKQYCHVGNIGKDCFKNPILQEILMTQNPLLEEHCVFGSHIFVPKRLDVQDTPQFNTVQQNLKSFLWMQD